MITVRLVQSARRNQTAGWALLGAGALLALMLPWLVYPPIAVDILAWALFAMSIDILFGYAGMLSFGHAAFWGVSAYATGLAAIELGVPFPLAILVGAVSAALVAVPIGLVAVRTHGIYFTMVTLAFAQLIYYIANRWSSLTGGENGLQGIPRDFVGLEWSDPFVYYHAALLIVAIGFWVAWRSVNSPTGQVLVALRANPARVRALGFSVERYRVFAFVLSAFLAGIAGGVYAIGHRMVTLQDLYWTTSGEGIAMAVLGGTATLFGSIVGAALLVLLEDFLATSGIEATGSVTGAVFVLILLFFRGGIWGAVSAALARLRGTSQDDVLERPPPTGPAVPPSNAAEEATTQGSDVK
ncbi:branched-chain amino acid ABC transporter permease [Nocardioides caldifontis]|uniref:branched-chain amino acid ABC transporter permease n=1 Tax=Nocardioides caldifontis TaxID=2588938 RepID=UPI0011E04E4E|nr:branched-chain amino acid ABC transporter permease [Nocardioides caldifontis]